MKDRILKKFLPDLHKRLSNYMRGGELIQFFDGDDGFGFEEFSGELIEIYGIEEDQIDLLLAYLYLNLRTNPEDYESIETFLKPKLQIHEVDVDEFWTVRNTLSYEPVAYFPSQAVFIVNEGTEPVTGTEEDYIEMDNRDTDYKGVKQ